MKIESKRIYFSTRLAKNDENGKIKGMRENEIEPYICPINEKYG